MASFVLNGVRQSLQQIAAPKRNRGTLSAQPAIAAAVLKEARVGHPTLVLNVPLAQQVGFTRADPAIALNEV
jgi:hypothetical protein